MLKCPKCGTELEYGMTECDFCFRKLTGRELLELEHQHSQKDYNTKFAKQYQRKKNYKKGIIVMLCIAAILIIAALVSQFVFNKSIFSLVKEGGQWVVGQASDFSPKEETDKEKFLRLESYAESVNRQCVNTYAPSKRYKNYDDYLLKMLYENLETRYQNEFAGDTIKLKTKNGIIIEFSWNNWMYVYQNGYTKIYEPQ